MAEIKVLGPDGLLKYDATFGVLICTDCEYAIQKSAIESHLLRHKIYRNSRQELLAAISQLDILEPDQVPIPPPASAPLSFLPILAGYRCRVPGCGTLLASEIRMKRHISVFHSQDELSRCDSPSFEPAKLQTFFRGRKLRYFEVCPLSPGYEDEIAPQYDTQVDFGASETYETGADASTSTPPPLSEPATHTFCHGPGTSPISVDLETLTYFHHFITTTSSTLPTFDLEHQAAQYWPSDVVRLALGQYWLMCGLLALAATHVAIVYQQITVRNSAEELITRFNTGFSDFFQATRDADVAVSSSEAEKRSVKAGLQIECILHFAQWAWSGYANDHSAELGSQSLIAALHPLIKGINDLIGSGETNSPSAEYPDQDGDQVSNFAQAREFIQRARSADHANFNALASGDITYFEMLVLNRIETLPERMAEVLDRPDNAQDVFAILSASATLLRSVKASFASRDMGVAWRSMAMWFKQAPTHFHHMIERDSPAALVILAHWAASLIKRAESLGCWFLQGLPEAILQEVSQRLPANSGATRGLLDGLLESA